MDVFNLLSFRKHTKQQPNSENHWNRRETDENDLFIAFVSYFLTILILITGPTISFISFNLFSSMNIRKKRSQANASREELRRTISIRIPIRIIDLISDTSIYLLYQLSNHLRYPNFNTPNQICSMQIRWISLRRISIHFDCDSSHNLIRFVLFRCYHSTVR